MRGLLIWNCITFWFESGLRYFGQKCDGLGAICSFSYFTDLNNHPQNCEACQKNNEL